jgi:hypothetical protein
MEKLSSLREDHNKLNLEHAKNKREAQLKFEQDKNHLLSLQDDLKKIKSQ